MDYCIYVRRCPIVIFCINIPLRVISSNPESIACGLIEIVVGKPGVRKILMVFMDKTYTVSIIIEIVILYTDCGTGNTYRIYISIKGIVSDDVIAIIGKKTIIAVYKVVIRDPDSLTSRAQPFPAGFEYAVGNLLFYNIGTLHLVIEYSSGYYSVKDDIFNLRTLCLDIDTGI